MTPDTDSHPDRHVFQKARQHNVRDGIDEINETRANNDGVGELCFPYFVMLARSWSFMAIAVHGTVPLVWTKSWKRKKASA